MTEFRLHAFELAYVLSLMRVDSVAALPNAVLFPKDPQVRRKALADGERRLLEAGLLTHDGHSGASDYDDDLLGAAAAVADPRITILVRRETADGSRGDVTLYLNRVVVVEVTQVDRHTFRVRRLDDALDALHRVRKSIGVRPGPPRPSGEAELRIDCFDRVRRAARDDPDAAADELEEAGMDCASAAALVEALARPRCKGTVSVLRHVARRVDDVRVVGYYAQEGATWLATTVAGSSSRVRVEAVGIDGFLRRLIERVTSLDEVEEIAEALAPMASR
ncbi:MAG: hypothetical protein ACRCT8_03775 [Lacipirellulaceae bacterium]